MRTQLLHLSGPLRGSTVIYEKDTLLVGNSSLADVPLVGCAMVVPRHAEISFRLEECTFHLRALDGSVFVNHCQVMEVILQDEDLLEFGEGGPMARFRIHVEPGSYCKPVHQMLGDARDVGRKSGILVSLKSLFRDLLHHASVQLRVVGFFIALVLVGSASYIGGRIGGNIPVTNLTLKREEMEGLRQRVEELKQRSMLKVDKTDLDALRSTIQKSAAVVDNLVEANQALGRVLEVYSLGVCLIHGVFGFIHTEGGKEEFLKGSDGEPLKMEYTGSGFLATAQGHVITNRHVAEPWWHSEDVKPLLDLGLTPRFLSLEVCFPKQMPIKVDPGTIKLRSDGLDVAVLRVDVKDVPVLPLFDGDPRSLKGQRAIVLGYPTGVNAVLAKADPEVADAVTSSTKDLTGLIAELARRNVIAPVVTQGALNDVQEKRLVYDASTTFGGSGGPVFGPGGTVVGVNFAVLREFGGSNFGVPIRFARELLP